MDTGPQIDIYPFCQDGIIEQIIGAAAERIYQAHGSQGGLDVSRAWIYQDAHQVEKVGKAKAAHYVGWIDPEGVRRCKSCGPGPDGLTNARKLRRKIEAQLLEGTYQSRLDATWDDFRAEYEAKILSGKSAATRRQALMSLGNFERLASPRKVSSITTAVIDGFTATRRSEKARYSDALVSVASVNADLRNLKAALNVAADWGYLREVPRVRTLREDRRLPVYVLPDHFAAIYRGCSAARLPAGCQGYTPADWWRALLVLIYQATGWRIGQALALLREDVDLTAGTVIARATATGNKAGQDRMVKLHPVAVDHLRRLPGFTPHVFPWPHDRRTLFAELKRVQLAAGLPGVYGWHNFRKGFNTLNAPRLQPSELQHLAQHASLATTLKYYVNPLETQEQAVGKLHVPECLRRLE